MQDRYNSERLTVIIVNRNTKMLLLDCLRSIRGQDYPARVIVVDNGSTDGSAEAVAASFPEVRLVLNRENLGFAKANNQALIEANSPYILLLNSDTILHPAGLPRMVAFMDQNLTVGVLGCKLLNPDGTLQHSCGIRPTLLTEFLNKTMLHIPLPVFKLGFWDYSSPREVDWVTGACMMVRQETLREVGLLDENIWMYYEDLDFCMRVKRTQWRVFFFPHAVATHFRRGSSRAIIKEAVVESQRSTYYFFRKHYGPVALQALRLMTLVEMLLRSLVWAVALLSSQRRPEARERLKAYFEIFRRSLADHNFLGL